MDIPLRELTPYMLNWGTYEQLVNEIWFVTRIYGGYFREWALDSQIKLKVWDTVTLVKDPTNKYDVNATEIRNEEWEFLGYVRKEIAAEIKDVDNFKVKVKNPYTWKWWGKKNDIGTEIIIVNLAELKKFKNVQTNKE